MLKMRVTSKGIDRIARSLEGQYINNMSVSEHDEARHVEQAIELIESGHRWDQVGDYLWDNGVSPDKYKQHIMESAVSSEQNKLGKKATTDEVLWRKADSIREVIGDGEFIDAMLKAMSIDEAEDIINFIWQSYEMGMLEEEI